MKSTNKSSIEGVRLAFFMLLLFISLPLFAQLQVDGGVPVLDLVDNYIGGEGVQIFNVQSNTGQPEQFGSFTNGNSLFGFNEGVVLATFDVEKLQNIGNVGQSQFPGLTGIPNIDDPDVEALLGGIDGHRNMAQIEFDFIPENRILEFTFVFGSEEYQEFVGSSYNDQFAMILTGPGYNGVNVATLPPPSNQVVSINTVNHQTNSNYYIDNPPSNGSDFALDGRTTAITVSVEVECNSQYHFKILILNRTDEVLGSAVFWERGSFQSNLDVSEITASPNPACEGTPLTLSVDGNTNYNYIWSTGESGVGLTQITTTASLQNAGYFVQAYSDVYPECYAEREASIVVHRSENLEPYSTAVSGVSGVNVNGEYEVYGQVEQEICFTVQTADSPGENVFITNLTGLPSGMVPTQSNTAQESITFCWTPGPNDFGEYIINLSYSDDNSCGSLSGNDVIVLRVVCPSCPMNITYDNRTPTNSPLPPVSIAGEWIHAGLNAEVNTGTADVLFQAGDEIVLGPHFTAGPGFVAEIVTTCWDETCEDCCSNWGGFTYDTPITNVITPNGDNCNDVWYVRDQDNPYCAFGATSFLLEIRDRWGVLVYRLEEFPGYCCPFRAPGTAPNPCPTQVPQEFSSIFWNGMWNQGPSNGCLVNNDTYFYTLFLNSGCGPTAGEAGFIEVLGSPGGCPGKRDADGDIADGTDSDTDKSQVNNVLRIYPNPNNGTFTIESDDMQTIEVYDAVGSIVKKINPLNSKIVLSDFTSGVYLVRVYKSKGTVSVERIVVFQK